MVSIIGQMARFIREISVMGSDMGMACGRIRINRIMGRIGWIGRKGWGSIRGKGRRSIRVSLGRIIGKAMVKALGSVGLVEK